MWPNPQEAANLVRFTEEILNGKLHFLSSVRPILQKYICKIVCVKCLGIFLILGFTKRTWNLLEDVEEETGEWKNYLSWCFGAYYCFLLFLESSEYFKILLRNPFCLHKPPYLNTTKCTRVIVNNETCIECARNASQSL